MRSTAPPGVIPAARVRAPALLVARMLKYLEPALALVPGLPDRWLRRLGFAVKVVRQLGRFA